MITRKNRHTLRVAIAIATVLALGTAGPLHADAVPGAPAPDFTATDANGQQARLSQLAGKVVVLEWTNHQCPYVGKHYGTGNMQALQSEAAQQGVVWLTVVSSAPGLEGHVDGAASNALTEARKARPAAVLLDPTGALGRLYGATATPHMFVIDKAGRLAYKGAIDDKPTANPGDIAKARNYVREALQAVAAGRPVQPAATRAYGCSIKYGAPKE